MLEQIRCRTGTTYPSLRSDTSIRDPTTGKFTLLVRGRLNAIFSSFFPSSFKFGSGNFWFKFGSGLVKAGHAQRRAAWLADRSIAVRREHADCSAVQIFLFFGGVKSKREKNAETWTTIVDSQTVLRRLLATSFVDSLHGTNECVRETSGTQPPKM